MNLEFGIRRLDPGLEASRQRGATHDAWVTLFTRRLTRLLQARARATRLTSPWVVHLLDLAIVSTYRDLQALGCAELAKALLRSSITIEPR